MEFEVFIPDNDCVRLISQFVEEMDLTALYGTYERMPSEKYASPTVLLKILLYAYPQGLLKRTADVISITCTFLKALLFLIMPLLQDFAQSILQNVLRKCFHI